MERSVTLTSNSQQLTSFPEILFLFVLAIQVSTLMGSASAIRLVSVDVPSPSLIGESVELSCLYDLQNEQLYSVKWYKDNVEFYRFVPNDWPPAQSLPAPGIHVDLSKSSQFTVYLTELNLRSAGKYRCEVSGEAPLFDTQEAEKDLQVFVLPSHGPTISGGQPLYKLGDNVHLNCTSAKSKPIAVLKWFINDQPVRPEYEIQYPASITSDGLESSTLGLKFSVTVDNFEQGNVRFRCVATISRAYTMTNEELVFGGLQAVSGAGSIHDSPRPIEGTKERRKAGHDHWVSPNNRTKRKADQWQTLLDFIALLQRPCISTSACLAWVHTSLIGHRWWL